MDVGGVFSAIVAGVVIGLLGRLVAPGRKRIGFLLTILVGIVGALVGSAVAEAADVEDWYLVLAVQVVAAALLVSAFRTSRR